jgi:hypothetical protein
MVERRRRVAAPTAASGRMIFTGVPFRNDPKARDSRRAPADLDGWEPLD